MASIISQIVVFAAHRVLSDRSVNWSRVSRRNYQFFLKASHAHCLNWFTLFGFYCSKISKITNLYQTVHHIHGMPKQSVSMRILQMVIEFTIFKVFKLLTLIIKAISLRKISNSLPAILPLPSWKKIQKSITEVLNSLNCLGNTIAVMFISFLVELWYQTKEYVS